MLADTVIADTHGCYCADTLYKYQVSYYRNLGAGLAQLACVKLLLADLKPEELDYMFEVGVLNAEDLTIGADSTSLLAMIKFDPQELIKKAKGVVNDPALLKKILSCGKRIASVTAATAMMPKTWNRNQVFRWSKQYKNCFHV